MDSTSILERTKKFLEEAPFAGESIDTKGEHYQFVNKVLAFISAN